MTYGHPVPVLGLIIMMMTTNDNIQMIYGTIHCLKLSPNLRRSLEEETNLEEKDEKLDVSNEENHFSKLFQISRNQKWKNYFLPKFLTNQRAEISQTSTYTQILCAFDANFKTNFVTMTLYSART